MEASRCRRTEWPTLALIAGCSAAWIVLLLVAHHVSPVIWAPLLVMLVTLHSSIQHEVTHGHPFRSERLNEALVFVTLGLFIPFRRFRSLHLTHHRDPNLTDPYEDPESYYVCPKTWRGLTRPVRLILNVNNTLAGRFFLGPAISLARFYKGEIKRILDGDRDVSLAWILHVPGVVGILFLAYRLLPGGILAYCVCAYFSMSILMIRTFLEHQAHELSRCRSVVIENGGVLGFLFLNNNLHVVHHACPNASWYELPGIYRARRDWFLRLNDGYSYRSYWEVIRLHAFRAKEPVAHPLMR